jgi:hypothetical protein
VRVCAGAWNTGWHHGADLMQWTGSQAQKDALARIHNFSQALHGTLLKVRRSHVDSPLVVEQLEQARWRLLRAETSCNLYWGEAWVHQIHLDLDEAQRLIEKAVFGFPQIQ